MKCDLCGAAALCRAALRIKRDAIYILTEQICLSFYVKKYRLHFRRSLTMTWNILKTPLMYSSVSDRTSAIYPPMGETVMWCYPAMWDQLCTSCGCFLEDVNRKCCHTFDDLARTFFSSVTFVVSVASVASSMLQMHNRADSERRQHNSKYFPVSPPVLSHRLAYCSPP